MSSNWRTSYHGTYPLLTCLTPRLSFTIRDKFCFRSILYSIVLSIICLTFCWKCVPANSFPNHTFKYNIMYICNIFYLQVYFCNVIIHFPFHSTPLTFWKTWYSSFLSNRRRMTILQHLTYKFVIIKIIYSLFIMNNLINSRHVCTYLNSFWYWFQV